MLRGDQARLRQVVLNLLSNAVKFTEHGGIRVDARLDGEASLCIEVHDTGVGIAAGDIDRIFEPFTQVDQSMTRVSPARASACPSVAGCRS